MSKYLDRKLNRKASMQYHIFDAQKKRFLLYYIYRHKLNAMRSAYWIVRWMPVGTTLEVIDVRTMALHAAYTHHADGKVSIFNETQVNAGLHLKHTRK